MKFVVRAGTPQPAGNLPATQQAVLQALVSAWQREQRARRWSSNSVTISIRTLAVDIGMSRSAVHRALDALVEAGMLRRRGVQQVMGLGFAVRTGRYLITEAGRRQRSTQPHLIVTADAFVEAGTGQLGRHLISQLTGRDGDPRLLARSAGTSLEVCRATLQLLEGAGLVESHDGRWSRRSGHEGNQLRAAASWLGTTGTLQARAQAYDDEMTSWLAATAAWFAAAPAGLLIKMVGA